MASPAVPDPRRFPVALVADALNAGSRAVALRCGFRLEGVPRHAARSPDGRLRDTCLYAKLPGDG